MVATSVLSMLVYRMRETRTAFAALMTLVWWTTCWPASLLDTSGSRVTPASGAQCVRLGVVRLARLYAAPDEVGNCGSGAHDGDDVGRQHAASQKLLNREAPEMA